MVSGNQVRLAKKGNRNGVVPPRRRPTSTGVRERCVTVHKVVWAGYPATLPHQFDLATRSHSGVLMRPPKPAANPGLAALIAGAGFRSLERFAQAVNHHGWDLHGVQTNYDHISVKRWLAGSLCQNPDVVAAVLSRAWGIPVPVEVAWPQLRDGAGPVPAHLAPWAAPRTLEDLGVFLRSDMLTRRETLTAAITAAPAPAIHAPIARWLSVPPGRLADSNPRGQRIGMPDVLAVERSTRYFAATDADVGGGLSREAAVGQLKYTVDLIQHRSYTDAVGNRLLAAIAELSGLVGWMCHDSAMPGPAQRYFMYGLQAARESTNERAPLLVVSILLDMASHMRWLDRPHAALRLHDLAASQLPADRSRFNVMRAILATKRVENGLCYLGTSCLPEVRNGLSLSLDLYARASDEDRTTARRLWHRKFDTSEAELSGMASAAYMVLAREDRRFAAEAQDRTLYFLTNVGDGQGRNQTFARIRLASARFLAGEPEQASEDGDQALDLDESSSASAMVRKRLRELLADSEPYAELPRVTELRDRIRTVLR